MKDFWLKEFVEEVVINFDNILEKIWFKEKNFIGYPEIIEKIMMEIFLHKTLLKIEQLLALNIAKNIPEIDPTTNLYFDFNKYNLFLIDRYKVLLEKNKKLLEPIKVFRIWGDIMNMGGLNISLSMDSELKDSEKISKNGYKRADLVRKLIFSSVAKSFLTFPAFLNHICIEGGDEIGGYFVANHYINENMLNDFILKTINKINTNLDNLGLGNIFYSKDRDSKKIIGIGISLIGREIDFKKENEIKFQSDLEKEILKNKESIGNSRVNFFKSPREKLNEKELIEFEKMANEIFKELYLDGSSNNFDLLDILNFNIYLNHKNYFDLNSIRLLKIKKDFLIRNFVFLNSIIKKFSFPQFDCLYRNTDLINSILLSILEKKILFTKYKTYNVILSDILKILIVFKTTNKIDLELEIFNRLKNSIIFENFINYLFDEEYKINYKTKLIIFKILNIFIFKNENIFLLKELQKELNIEELNSFLEKNIFFIVIKQNNFAVLNKFFSHDYCNEIFDNFKKIIVNIIEKEKEFYGINPSDIVYFNSATNSYSTRNKIAIIANNIDEKKLSYILKKVYIELKKEIIKNNLDIFIDNNIKISGIDFTFIIEQIPLNLLDKKDIEDFLYSTSKNIRVIEDSGEFLNSKFVDTGIIKKEDMGISEKNFKKEQNNYKIRQNTKLNYL